MLVSITSTSPDATDLGYLLHKHPDRVRSVDVGFGQAHVFYPEASSERCTATLVVEVDPVGLSRGNNRQRAVGLEPYVNDRPYAASSMLSVAMGRLYGSALRGSCESRPDLVATALDLTIVMPVVPVRGGEDVLRRVFEPLGYGVSCAAVALDEQFPGWGDSRYFSVELSATMCVQSVLEHLYVLLPVLDDRKHYWIGPSEVDKLLRRGGQWLASHPENELIARRYLRFGGLARDALARLAEGINDPDHLDGELDQAEAKAERPLSLNQQRLDAVADAVVSAGAKRVVDLGCGEGRLVKRLLGESSVSFVLGVDVSIGALERAERRLRLESMTERRRERVHLVQGALSYRDERISGFDAATVVEVIEHLDPYRLDVFAEVVFHHAVPQMVVVTTPNREYNVHFPNLDPASLRHGDHRFEWTRSEFEAWCETVSSQYNYTYEWSPIGHVDDVTGPPTQMAVFRRGGEVAQ